MRKAICIHLIVLGVILLCAFSPWLLMLVLSIAGASSRSALEDLGLGIGYLGLAITPLGLLAAGIYLAAAVIFHYAFTAWRRASGKPAAQGYLLALSIVALSGAALFIIYFAFVTASQNIAEKGRVTPAVLNGCRDLMTETPNSPKKNGVIALGIYSNSSEDEQFRLSLMLLNPDGTLLRSMPLQIDLHSLAWSPAGSFLALSDETNLYLLDAANGEMRPITDESPLEDHASLITNPAWSPDGSTVYFEKRMPGEGINLEIFALQPDGSAMRQLSDTPGYNILPRPSPDGTQIAFVSSRLGGSAIFLMDEAGGNIRQLSSGSSTDTDPAWSPDGQWLAFLSNPGGKYQVFILNANSGNTCQLTGSGMQPSSPVWSPDGKSILFIDQAVNDLVLVSPDGRDVQRWQLEDMQHSQAVTLDWASAKN